MNVTVAIIIVWALVVLLPFVVAVPMMFRARTALKIADGRFLLAFSGLLAADGSIDPAEDLLLGELAADFGLGNEVYIPFKTKEAPVLSRAELRRAGVPLSLMHLVK